MIRMRDKGFIMLSRKFFSNRMWEAARTFSECEAWLDLIQSARFEAAVSIERIGGREVTYGRGQYPASIRFLAAKWGWGERRVRSFLDGLRKERMISTDDSQGTTVITLCKYDEYNSPVSAKDTPKDTSMEVLISELKELKTQLTTQQKTQGRHSSDTKYNKEKNINNNISPSIPPFEESVALAPASGETTFQKAATWRDDYEIYLSLVRAAYNALKDDKAMVEKQQGYYPNVAIIKSVEKACVNFWATQAGWKHKKKSRGTDIDMKMTLINAIAKNRVFENETTTTKRYDNGDILR